MNVATLISREDTVQGSPRTSHFGLNMSKQNIPVELLTSARGRSGQKPAQHELQNASVAEVGNLVGGVDSQHKRQFRSSSVGMTYCPTQAHARPDFSRQSGKIDEFPPGEPVIGPRLAIGKNEWRDSHADQI